jgi:hypothetical protein
MELSIHWDACKTLHRTTDLETPLIVMQDLEGCEFIVLGKDNLAASEHAI